MLTKSKLGFEQSPSPLSNILPPVYRCKYVVKAAEIYEYGDISSSATHRGGGTSGRGRPEMRTGYPVNDSMRLSYRANLSH